MSLDSELSRVKFSKSMLKKSPWTVRQSVSHAKAAEGFYRGHPSGPTHTPTGRLRKRPRVLPTRGEGWPPEEKKGKIKKAVAKKTKKIKLPQSIQARSRINWGKTQRKTEQVRHQRSRRGG